MSSSGLPRPVPGLANGWHKLYLLAAPGLFCCICNVCDLISQEVCLLVGQNKSLPAATKAILQAALAEARHIQKLELLAPLNAHLLQENLHMTGSHCLA